MYQHPVLQKCPICPKATKNPDPTVEASKWLKHGRRWVSRKLSNAIWLPKRGKNPVPTLEDSDESSLEENELQESNPI